MELDIREILLCHGQYITGIGQINITAFFVKRHILRFTLLEIIQSDLIVTFNPASFIKTDRFPFTLGTIFMQQTVLDYFKLQ